MTITAHYGTCRICGTISSKTYKHQDGHTDPAHKAYPCNVLICSVCIKDQKNINYITRNYCGAPFKLNPNEPITVTAWATI